MSDVSCYGRDGHPRLLSQQCGTCIYRPGNPMHLRAGRLKEMTRDALRQGSQGVICHATLPYGAHQDFAPALCRGFYDLYGPRNNFIRCITRLGALDGSGGFTIIDPPEDTDV